MAPGNRLVVCVKKGNFDSYVVNYSVPDLVIEMVNDLSKMDMCEWGLPPNGHSTGKSTS
jgi:hypothetical protein